MTQTNAPTYTVEYRSIRGTWLAIGRPCKSEASAIRRATSTLATSHAGRDMRVVESIATRGGAIVPTTSIAWQS